MDKAFERGKLSLRGYHKVWKVARTIADIEESEYIERKHVTEALSYRERKIE
jgi:magnesium chelatase family protein